jgi:uncharacterized protein (DUF1684 family)
MTLVAACSTTQPEDYVSRVTAERARKDESFRTDKDSPILPEDRDRFLPLSYFPVDEAYAVPAELQPATERNSLQMPTSTGKLRPYERVGTLAFTLHGQRMTLTAFFEVGSPNAQRLFVPFADLTSGTETYPAGRYMELDPTATGIYIVDFNVAYNPYCYYNAAYDCPFPPSENRLQTAVRAGERLPSPEISEASPRIGKNATSGSASLRLYWLAPLRGARHLEGQQTPS